MSDPHNPSQQADAQTSAAGCEAAPSSGLVGLVTSGTWNHRDPEIQRFRRLSRMRRALLNSGDEINAGLQRGGFRYRCVLLTLTYRDVDGWSARHLSDLLSHARRWLARRGCPLRYLWVAELQKRGAVHYHVVLWLPRGVTLPKPDKQGWWPHGMTKVEWARKPIGYLAKYVSKAECMERFPKGLRLHARGGLEEEQRRRVSWWLLPRYVREHFTELGSRVIRQIGGGWLHVDTGEWIPAWSASPAPS
jgi:hypothetical protein